MSGMCTADVSGAGTVACGWACGRDCAIYEVDSLTPTQCAAVLTKLTVPGFCSVRVFLEGVRERPNNTCNARRFSVGIGHLIQIEVHMYLATTNQGIRKPVLWLACTKVAPR